MRPVFNDSAMDSKVTSAAGDEELYLANFLAREACLDNDVKFEAWGEINENEGPNSVVDAINADNLAITMVAHKKVHAKSAILIGCPDVFGIVHG
jgi:hypothetical protein